MKKVICILLSALLLSGCVRNPQHNAVVSKNDGSFDTRLVQSSTEPEPSFKLLNFYAKEEFMSTDESVSFKMDISESFSVSSVPVVEVVPHNLNGIEAEKIARVLFGDVDYYESDPVLAQTYSKSQINLLLTNWARYVNEDEMRELYKSSYEDDIDFVQALIERFTLLLESASEENQDRISSWEMKKESYYIYSEEEANQMDTSKENDKISVSLVYKNLPYQFSVTTRNQNDFKINNIRATLTPNSPADIDYDILRAELCRTDKPTEEELDNVKKQVEHWLSKMDLGAWQVRECNVRTRFVGDVPEYTIHVNAVPQFCGVAAMYRNQLYNLKSDKAYASNYYLTDANFIFAPGGELINFEMYSPVDVSDVITENAVILSTDLLIERAKNYLMLSDMYTYGLGDSLAECEEDMICTVEVVDLDYGLTRVKAPNTDDCYNYVPAITLRGNVNYTGRTSNSLYYTTEESPAIILILNAVDGSVIDHSGI